MAQSLTMEYSTCSYDVKKCDSNYKTSLVTVEELNKTIELKTSEYRKGSYGFED